MSKELFKREKLVELLRVQAAKAEMELNIFKKLDEVERLKGQIELQTKREIELKEEIANHG
jgi:hypothetical protein